MTYILKNIAMDNALQCRKLYKLLKQIKEKYHKMFII